MVPYGTENAIGKKIEHLDIQVRRQHYSGDSLGDKLIIRLSDGSQLEIDSRLARPEGQWHAELSAFVRKAPASHPESGPV